MIRSLAVGALLLVGNINTTTEALPPAVLDCDLACDLAPAVARVEGWWAGPRTKARRHHNPGNLVYTGQLHASRAKDGSAAFDSDEHGWRALRLELRRRIFYRGRTHRMFDGWSALSSREYQRRVLLARRKR